MPMKAKSPERPLGFIEKFQLSRRLAELYSCFQITSKFTHPISKELLSNALKILIGKYNMLRLTVRVDPDGDTKDYNNYIAVPAKALYFDDIVEIKDRKFTPEDIDDINAQLIPVGENISTWKLVLYPDGHLTFYTNHVFTDGQSGSHFFEELAKIFDQLSGKSLDFVPELVEGTPFTMPKEITELVDIYDCSVAKGLKTLTGWQIRLTFKRLVKPIKILNPYKSTQHASYKSSFKMIEVENKKIQTILSILRPENATLTAFIDVLLRYTAQKVILSKITSKPTPTRSGIVTSARRFYPELQEEVKFQNFMSESLIILPPVLSMNRVPAFKAMKEINELLDRDLEKKTMFTSFGILKKVGVDMLTEPSKKIRTTDNLFEISNLGYKPVKQGEWQIEKYYFAQPSSVSAPFDVSIISSSQYLTLGLSYCKEYLMYDYNEFEKVFHEGIDFFINDKR